MLLIQKKIQLIFILVNQDINNQPNDLYLKDELMCRLFVWASFRKKRIPKEIRDSFFFWDSNFFGYTNKKLRKFEGFSFLDTLIADKKVF
ncbi:hypothetical protein MHB57_27840 [Bacillus sp. FSL L8-0315]|uniref:hypothetical protein n=1 Tax=Bacillus sp. FSL L8-0315 TaxID=2921522 RepID=UPI001145D218